MLIKVKYVMCAFVCNEINVCQVTSNKTILRVLRSEVGRQTCLSVKFGIYAICLVQCLLIIFKASSDCY